MQLLNFAANVRRDTDSFFHGKLDVLINNAGANQGSSFGGRPAAAMRSQRGSSF
jgi:NAD(P)-dependent dehydrogenase (short-subunit alcohol dehydrogenase family)